MVTINLSWPKLFAGIGSLLFFFVSAMAWVRSDLKEDIRENRQLIIKYIAKD